MSNKIALFIGRFQPLHKGHKHAIERLKEEFEVKILIGSAQAERTSENPLSYSEREKIFLNCLPDLQVQGRRDLPSDERWTKTLIANFEFDFVVSGNSRVRRCFENYEIEVRAPEFHSPEKYKGEIIRERIKKGEEWRHLVPGCSLEKLEELDFAEIVRTCS